MGYQTNYKKCKTCNNIIIKTIVSYLGLKREIIITNCKCKQFIKQLK